MRDYARDIATIALNTENWPSGVCERLDTGQLSCETISRENRGIAGGGGSRQLALRAPVFVVSRDE